MNKPTHTLLTEHRQAGLFRVSQSQLGALQKVAAALPMLVHEVDIGCQPVHLALVTLGKALHFPAWYGANLDALCDCLSDPDSFPAPDGFLLVLRGHSQTLAALADALHAAAEARNTAKTPAWILLLDDLTEIPLLPAA